MAQEIDWLVLGTTALTSGLAGAALNQWLQRRLERYKRPRLHLAFEPGVDGCEVDTETADSHPSKQRYLRLKVLNTSRSPAENVNVSVTRISFVPHGKSQPFFVFKDEVLDLNVSLTGDNPLRIAAEGHRFMDIIRLQQTGSHLLYDFEFRTHPSKLKKKFEAGEYTANVFASADGADPVRRTIRWSWDGTLGGLHALGVSHRTVD
jgi:hypothetical protein